jgi:hypothetical protein
MIREQEEICKERETLWKGFDAARTEAEAKLRKLKLLQPLVFIQLTVYFKLFNRLGVFDRGMVLFSKWRWEYRRMALDAN